MVTKIQKLWSGLDWLQKSIVKTYGYMLTIVATFAFGTIIGGCATKKSYEPLILTLGQSAVLLEDVRAIARIPYQGDELYEGPVVFQKGSMVVKPRVEP